ncbi:hypothetical protein [Rhodopirellula bahusiensis]|uniref:hypothetical protein n=1 Tax=Rhodopirellula bahusiensis TaxID=2014065 RepID=UPI00326425D7
MSAAPSGVPLLWKPTPSSAVKQTTRTWAVSLAAVGSIALATSLVCVVTETTRLMLVLSSIGRAEIAWINSGVAATLSVATIAYAFPIFSRAFGVRAKHWFPKLTRRKLRLSDLATERRALRGCLIVLAAFPLQTSLAHSVMVRSTRGDTFEPIVSAWWFLLLAIVMMAVGALVHFRLPQIYLKCRFESLLNGLRHYPRGVALRSFIAQWDNPTREIYTACRVSRRVAWAYRVGILISAACFTAAGCLLARVELPWMLDELGTVIAIASVFSLWPTATRMVNWSGLVLDPICGDPDEFDDYE